MELDMVITDLIAQVNRNLARCGAEFVPISDTSGSAPASVHGTIANAPVRLDFTVGHEHPDYDYNVWVYSPTGESLGHGNGASNFEDAIDMYHWQGVVADLRG